MAQGKKEEGMALKDEVTRQAQQLAELEAKEAQLTEEVNKIMMQIMQMYNIRLYVIKPFYKLSC